MKLTINNHIYYKRNGDWFTKSASHKYFRREPDGKGSYRYFYTKDEYVQHLMDKVQGKVAPGKTEQVKAQVPVTEKTVKGYTINDWKNEPKESISQKSKEQLKNDIDRIWIANSTYEASFDRGLEAARRFYSNDGWTKELYDHSKLAEKRYKTRVHEGDDAMRRGVNAAANDNPIINKLGQKTETKQDTKSENFEISETVKHDLELLQTYYGASKKVTNDWTLRKLIEGYGRPYKNHWLFDAKLHAVAPKLGLKIEEMPVHGRLTPDLKIIGTHPILDIPIKNWRK